MAVTDQFGLEDGDYEAMLEAQHGRCAICRRYQKGKKLARDHDHHSGLVRGLLCDYCNRILLGFFHDNADLFQNAADYLRDPPSVQVIGRKFVRDSIGADLTNQEND